MEEKEIKAVDILTILFERRWFLIKNFLLVAVASVIISLLLPKWYTSSSVILPPASSAPELSAFTSGSLGNILGGMAGMSNNSVDVYLAILNSRTLRQTVIDKFNLADVYELKGDYYIETVFKILNERTGVNYDMDTGVITVSYLDKDPQLAADVANFYISQLDKINKELSVQKAKIEREFLEKRVEMNYKEIDQAEQTLKEFQEKYNAISIPEQMAAALRTAAEVKAELIAYQIQYEVGRASMDADHPSLIELKKQINVLKKKLGEFNNPSSDFGENIGLFLGFSDVPTLQKQYTELFREVEVQNALLEFLLPQYEGAKIQESKDTPTLQVLDSAVPAEKKTKPKRAVVVILSCVFCTVVAILYIFVVNYFERKREEFPEDFDKWQKISDWIKSDFSKVPIIRRFVSK